MTAAHVSPAPSPPVVVFGSINTDLVVRTPQFPRPGETLAGSDFLTVGGGKGANQAVAAARMGADVRFIGAVGADDFGARRLAELAADGVDVAAVRLLPDTATGVALITVDAAGENTIVLAAGANGSVSSRDAAAYDFAAARGGVLVAQLELPLAAVVAAVRAAKAAGMLTLLNPAPYHHEARRLLRSVDILVANEGEAAGLAGWDGAITPAVAAKPLVRIRAQGPEVVVITLGAAGAVVIADGAVTHLPAPPVRVVDTTGAGDCFVGVFAAGLVAGMPVVAAARRAVVAASHSTTVRGATAGMPTRAQLPTVEARTDEAG